MMEEKQWWYFIFKPETRHKKKFFKLFGTFKQTQREANKRYHDDWNIQLAEEYWNALQAGEQDVTE